MLQVDRREINLSRSTRGPFLAWNCPRKAPQLGVNRYPKPCFSQLGLLPSFVHLHQQLSTTLSESLILYYCLFSRYAVQDYISSTTRRRSELNHPRIKRRRSLSRLSRSQPKVRQLFNACRSFQGRNRYLVKYPRDLPLSHLPSC